MFNSLNSIIRTVLIACLLIVAIVLGAILYFQLAPEEVVVDKTWSTLDEDPILEENEKYVYGEKDPELSGKILMSLSPKVFSNEVKTLPFMFDFQRQKIVDTEMDKYGENEYGVARDVMFSPNREWAAFYGATARDAGVGKWDPERSLQMYRADLRGIESDSFEASLDDIKERAEKISDIEGRYKTLSSINNGGGALMFSSDYSSGTSIQPAEYYTIRYLSPEGETTELTKGTYPKWISMGHFVFIKNDGLYSYSLDTSTEKQLVKYSGELELSSNSMFNVSKNGDFAAFSLPDTQQVVIFKMDVSGVKNDIKAEQYGVIEASGFWPVFSPDGEFFVLQEVDWNKFENSREWREIENPEPQLSLWRIDSLEKLDYAIDLKGYRQDYVFVSDWVK